MRRGKPTVHRAFDDATAILAGDGLLTYAFELAATLPASDGDRAAVTAALARAAGLGGMVGGQLLDLAAEGRFDADGQRAAHTQDSVRTMQAMKTGALILVAVQCGAILGGASPAERAALDGFGRQCGAAFQIADDILDVEASAEALGKATGKDDARARPPSSMCSALSRRGPGVTLARLTLSPRWNCSAPAPAFWRKPPASSRCARTKQT